MDVRLRGSLGRSGLARPGLTRAALARAGLAAAVTALLAAAASLALKFQRMFKERQRLTLAALHDPLTGLANRTKLAQRLEAALSEAAQSGWLVGILFCDLDGFRQVNKEHGHAAGDLLLAATALRIESAVRPTDTVARLGGDEFVVVCPGLSPSESEANAALAAIANRIRDAVGEPFVVGEPVVRSEPFVVGEPVVRSEPFAIGEPARDISLQISIGAAVANSATLGSATSGNAASAALGSATSAAPGGGGTAAWLLRQADLAMSHAKLAQSKLAQSKLTQSKLAHPKRQPHQR